MTRPVEIHCRDCFLVKSWIGIDFAQQGVWRGTRFISLPVRTFSILAYLVHHPNAVIPTEQLLAVGWPNEPRVPGDLTRHIHRIRQVIEVHSRHPKILVNRRGAGYCFHDVSCLKRVR